MTIISTLPNNIQDGQVADAAPVMANFNAIVNEVNANAAPLGYVPLGTLLSIQALVATGVYTPNPAATKILAILQGPGGGGAGATATASNSVSAAGSGGAGGRAFAIITSGFSGQTATLPSGGAGGSNGGAGTAGGNATFIGLTANGGLGGGVATSATAFGDGGLGGSASGGLINTQGAQGGWTDAVLSVGLYHTTPGANSEYGAGGAIVAAGSNGSSATGFGAGGGGTTNGPSAASGLVGGNGSGSLLLIYEYS
jgi:hypothetical protein